MPMTCFLAPRAARMAAAGLTALAVVGCNGPAADHAEPDLGLIRDVMKRVETHYVAPVQDDQLTTDALKGMLSHLDPHSSYLDPAEYRELEADLRGQFGGVGIQVTEQNGLPRVISPIDGTPAASAGIQPGDLIVAIDGHGTEGMDLQQVVKEIRGKEGTSVRLTIDRTGRPPFDTLLMRQIIHVHTVDAKPLPNQVAYVRISAFEDDTQNELAAALDRLKRESGGRLRGLVLDLRNDPGGLLSAAVGVAGDFLNGGPVVSTRGRESGDDKVYAAPDRGDLAAGAPIIVLINNASASASEIVAAALQDRGRAIVMGTRSFGKGSVQTVIPLHGHGAMRLTTALYFTPSGRSIQGQGVMPDVVVEAAKDTQVDNTLVVRESALHGALKNGDSSGTTVAALSNHGPAAAANNSPPIRPELIGTDKDAQLQAALARLQHRE